MIKIDAVHGNRHWLDGGGMFGHVPRSLWSTWVTPDALGRIELTGRCLLVRTETQTVLFDTGIGCFFAPKLRGRFGVQGNDNQLLASLRAHQVEPEEIDAVVLSHLHFDHAGGLVTPYDAGRLRLAFPNASYYVSKLQWERACRPHMRDRVCYVPLFQTLLEESGRLELIEQEGRWSVDPRFEFVFSHGHTPGLMLTRIWREGLPPVCFVSDLMPGTHWVHLPVTAGFDRFPELVVDEKRLLLEWAAETHAQLYLYHDPEVGVITITREGTQSGVDALTWRPVQL